MLCSRSTGHIITALNMLNLARKHTAKCGPYSNYPPINYQRDRLLLLMLKKSCMTLSGRKGHAGFSVSIVCQMGFRVQYRLRNGADRVVGAMETDVMHPCPAC